MAKEIVCIIKMGSEGGGCLKPNNPVHRANTARQKKPKNHKPATAPKRPTSVPANATQNATHGGEQEWGQGCKYTQSKPTRSRNSRSRKRTSTLASDWPAGFQRAKGDHNGWVGREKRSCSGKGTVFSPPGAN